MKNAIRRIANGLVGWQVGKNIRLSLGTNSRVHFWGLRSQRAGTLSIGNDCIVRARFDFDGPDGKVQIGDRCFIGASHLVCRELIQIGDDVVISWGVTVVDHDSHSIEWAHRRHDVRDWMRGEKDWSRVRVAPVTISNKVWIGFGASVLRGTTIGEGAVVGANSVVTKDVMPYTVVAGNPARYIKTIST